MPVVWAQFDDVARRFNRPIPDAQKPWVSSLLEDAHDELARQVPDLAARVPTPMPVVRVQRIVAAAVIRVLRNPEGYIAHSRSTGPFSESSTRESAGGAGAGQVRFTDDELATLRGPDKPPVAAITVGIPGWRVP